MNRCIRSNLIPYSEALKIFDQQLDLTSMMVDIVLCLCAAVMGTVLVLIHGDMPEIPHNVIEGWF